MQSVEIIGNITTGRSWQSPCQDCPEQAEVRRVRRGVHWVHVHPPPHLGKSSAQKCPKEKRKFRPDMSAKKNVHVLLRYHKIKTKKPGKKKKIVKGKD